MPYVSACHSDVKQIEYYQLKQMVFFNTFKSRCVFNCMHPPHARSKLRNLVQHICVKSHLLTGMSSGTLDNKLVLFFHHIC